MQLSCKASFNTALGSTYCSLANSSLEPKWYTKPGYPHFWLRVHCFWGFKDIHLHTSKGITQLSPLITAIKLTSISFQIISATWQLSICQTVQLSHWEAAYQRKNDAGALKQYAADKTCRTQHGNRNLLLSGCPFFLLERDIRFTGWEDYLTENWWNGLEGATEVFCLLPNISFFSGCTVWFKNPNS